MIVQQTGISEIYDLNFNAKISTVNDLGYLLLCNPMLIPKTYVCDFSISKRITPVI